eukprot:TRINITY_DN26159_c0_g1_i2.p2 TRINITY_DN26159_c0_g1~~TRINITY_DN26159_c0_g1_i2.p2  ORF type:complete len:115 (+),score=31.55 TRINITY_DN26159_c0_g1_i2:119-463(+)
MRTSPMEQLVYQNMKMGRLASERQWEAAAVLLHEMHDTGVEADRVTFLSCMKATRDDWQLSAAVLQSLVEAALQADVALQSCVTSAAERCAQWQLAAATFVMQAAAGVLVDCTV